jgi:hypothetical protein
VRADLVLENNLGENQFTGDVGAPNSTAVSEFVDGPARIDRWKELAIDVIVTPLLRIFANFGRTVDGPWGVGRLSQWDELQLEITYQF